MRRSSNQSNSRVDLGHQQEVHACPVELATQINDAEYLNSHSQQGMVNKNAQLVGGIGIISLLFEMFAQFIIEALESNSRVDLEPSTRSSRNPVELATQINDAEYLNSHESTGMMKGKMTKRFTIR